MGIVVAGISAVSGQGILDIRPPPGEEWVIINIYHEFDVDLGKTDGTNTIWFDTDTGAGVYAKFAIHLTNSVWLRVRNRDTNTAATKLIGYDGVKIT